MDENPLTNLEEKVRLHWEKYRPQMTARLKAAGRFEEMAHRAAAMTGEAVLGHIDKSTARTSAERFWEGWELYREEWAFLPAEEEVPDPGIEPLSWGDVSRLEETDGEPGGLEVEFTRGEYGEIVPPPLLSHLTPEEAIRRLYAVTALRGGHLDKPATPAGKQVVLNRALQLAHGLRLREVVAGTALENDIERALYEAVRNGALLSLRPLGLESWDHPSFAPVIRYAGGDEWQIGLPEAGRMTVLHAAAGEVIEQAQAVYLRWTEDEIADRKGKEDGNG